MWVVGQDFVGPVVEFNPVVSLNHPVLGLAGLCQEPHVHVLRLQVLLHVPWNPGHERAVIALKSIFSQGLVVLAIVSLQLVGFDGSMIAPGNGAQPLVVRPPSQKACSYRRILKGDFEPCETPAFSFIVQR